jgi:hypothetical protein
MPFIFKNCLLLVYFHVSYWEIEEHIFFDLFPNNQIDQTKWTRVSIQDTLNISCKWLTWYFCEMMHEFHNLEKQKEAYFKLVVIVFDIKNPCSLLYCQMAKRQMYVVWFMLSIYCKCNHMLRFFICLGGGGSFEAFSVL